MNQLKQLLGHQVHLEGARGSPQQNVDYCSKEESKVKGPWRIGQEPLARKRKQAEVAMEMIRKGHSELDIAETVPAVWLTYRRSLMEYRLLLQTTSRSWKTITTWYWGGTGTGKTKLAHILTKRKAWVAPDASGQWFDGYNNHESVIFDDLEVTDCPRRAMFLRLFDRYPMKVPIKGGFVEWAPRRAFITSNFRPENIYMHDPAILRRIDFIFEIN
jgi:predicted ATPase